MKLIKKIYIYWFCAFYKFIETSWFQGANVFRTTTLMLIFEGFLLGVIFGNYLLYTKVFIPLGNPYFFLIPIGLVLSIHKYFVFDYKAKWKSYISLFNSFPINKRRRIVFFSWIFNIVVIICLIWVFILLSKIEWIN